MYKDIPKIRVAEARENFQLFLSFDDGICGIVDLSEYLGKGVFKYWDDEKNFSTFRITSNKKLEWNEYIDMDPDAFYLKIINKSFEDYARDKSVLRNSH